MSHSETRASKPFDGSARLVAVLRVLHRLPMPRHPSCARIRLARKIVSVPSRNSLASRYVAVLFSFQIFRFSKNEALAGERTHSIPFFRVLAQGGKCENFGIGKSGHWRFFDSSILRFFDWIYDLRFTIGLRHWRIWAMGEWRFFDWIYDLRFTIYDWIEALANLGNGLAAGGSIAGLWILSQRRGDTEALPMFSASLR